MKKYIKNLVLVIVLIVGVLSLTGCGEKDSRVVGTWEYKDDGISAVYVLKEDGTGSYNIIVSDANSFKNLTYETKDGKLLITFEDDTDVFELKYKVTKDALIITDSLGEDLKYKKK